MFGFNDKPKKKSSLSPAIPSSHHSEKPIILPNDTFQMTNPFKKPSNPSVKNSEKAISNSRNAFEFKSSPLSPPNPFFDSNKRTSSLNQEDTLNPPKKFPSYTSNASYAGIQESENLSKSNPHAIDDYDLLDLEIMESNPLQEIQYSNAGNSDTQKTSDEKVTDAFEPLPTATPTHAKASSDSSDRVYKAHGIVFNEIDFMKRYTGEIEKINLHIKGF